MKKKWIGLIVVVLVVATLLGMPFVLSFINDAGSLMTLQSVYHREGTAPEMYPVYASAQEALEQMTPMLENSAYALYAQTDLATVALLEKSTQRVYFSSPWDLGVQVSDADGAAALASQILLTYYDETGMQGQMNSFRDCVMKNQFEFVTADDKLTMHMTVGEAGESAVYPEQISASSMEALMAKMDEDGTELIDEIYERFSLFEYNEDMQKAMLEQYPYLDREDVYVLSPMPKRTKRKAEELFNYLGYTLEDRETEYRKIGFESEISTPAFSLSLCYQLTDDGLTVSLPLEAISFNSKKFQLDTISLLPYFGCGATTDKEGYLFVPDGSGTVINYNSAYSKRLSSLAIQVYGTDAAAVSEYSGEQDSQPVIFPVFGNSHVGGGFVAVINDGESLCQIVADAGNANEPYASVYPTVQYKYSELFYYNDKEFSKNVRAYADVPNAGTVSVSFLPMKDGNRYTDMAKVYRNYLLKAGILTENPSKPRLLLQLLGLAEGNDGRFALTTFDDAAAIVNDLTQGGVESTVLRYVGWNANGLDNRYTKDVSLPSLLGGKNSFHALTEIVDRKQIPLYMDFELSYVRRTGLLDGYSVNQDSCRTIRNHLTGRYAYNYGENEADKSSLAYAVCADALCRSIEMLKDSAANVIGNHHISAGSLGNTLHSNFKPNQITTRDEAEKRIVEGADMLTASQRIMVDGGYAYMLEYTDFITDIPTASSGFEAADYDIPFVQLVLNGCVDYAGAPINESISSKTQLMKALEIGAQLNFITAYRNQSKLKNSDQCGNYSVNYETLRDTMISLFEEYRQAFDRIGTMNIVSHTRLADQVYCTEYESGATVTVNYGVSDYSANGLTVSAGDYHIDKGGENR